jgi:DNA-binding CsgD family transcriptional regulator/tetratricopeptide (TPR) repeat protein
MATLAPSPRLRGREVELEALGATLDRAASGRLAIAIVDGEAGIGKTRLLAQALQDARGRGFRDAAGRAHELERTRPFGLLADALGCDRSAADPRRAAIAALLTTRAGERGAVTVSSDPGLQFQAVDALVDLVETLALERPLALGLDDLQWADPSSLLTLAALARRLADLPVALVGCLRPMPRAGELERALEAMEAAGGRRLPLDRLGEQAVAELVADTIAAEPGRTLLAEVAAAGGNPLFVTELLGALLAEGAVQTVEGRAEVAEPTLPPTLRLTILRRLSFLPDDTLQALRAAAILGSSFSLTDLSVTTGRPVLELSTVLAAAIRARILEEKGDRLRFRHDLIHEAIYLDLPASARVGLHREAGRRLAESGAAALQVAEHLARGAGRGDAAAIDWLVRAAREAAGSSPAVAAELLERAIGLLEPADPGRDQLLAERAGALMAAGRLTEAEAAYRRLLDRDHDPSVDAPARLWLARTLSAQGRMGDALRELQLLQRFPTLEDQLRAAVQGSEGVARLELGDLDGAAAAADQARSTAATAGNHPIVSLATAAQAMVEELRAHLDGALRIVEDGMRLADRSPQRQGHRYPLHFVRGRILLELDRLGEARSTLQDGRRVGEQLGMHWSLSLYEVFLAMERFLAGEWDDALAGFQAALELATETGERYSVVLVESVRSLIALHRGDLSDAEQAVARAERELAGTGPRYRSHWAMWARALLLEAGGATVEAYASLAGCWDLCARSGLAVDYPVLGPDLVRLALAAGERARAERVAAAVAEVAAGNQAPSLAGAALRCQGLLEGDPAILRAAVDAYAKGPRPLQLALAAEDAGAAAARQGAVQDAVPLLRQAIEFHERLGAARDAARVEARLRELGIRRGRRGPRKRPQIGWESLTPTERTVVDLVAEGLTNPQIGERLYISRRTVQTHLVSVFAKLSISSRVQLAAEAARRRTPGARPD